MFSKLASRLDSIFAQEVDEQKLYEYKFVHVKHDEDDREFGGEQVVKEEEGKATLQQLIQKVKATNSGTWDKTSLPANLFKGRDYWSNLDPVEEKVGDSGTAHDWMHHFWILDLVGESENPESQKELDDYLRKHIPVYGS